MSKDFKNKGRMERLASILNTLVPQLIKRNKQAAKELIKMSQPSIVSVYNNTLKLMKFHETQLKMYEEMKKENVKSRSTGMFVQRVSGIGRNKQEIRRI